MHDFFNHFNLNCEATAKLVFNQHQHIPNNVRMLIIDSSASDETNVLLRMIVNDFYLDFNNLIIYSPTAYQRNFN